MDLIGTSLHLGGVNLQTDRASKKGEGTSCAADENQDSAHVGEQLQRVKDW